MEQEIEKLVELVGGKDNILSVSHCLTRLRFVLKDKKLFAVEQLEQMDVVKGCFQTGEQSQIIVGPEVPKVYEALVKVTGIKADSVAEGKALARSKKNYLQRFVALFADVFVPILPAIVAAGLLMGINNVLSNQGIFWQDASILDKAPGIQGIAGIINIIANTSFVFLPALVGWSAVKRFGGNPLLGVVLGLILVHPDLMNIYDFVNPDNASKVQYFDLFGWKIARVGYQGQVLPVLLASFLLAKTELFLKKRTPGTIQLLVVAPVALLVTGFVTLVGIGPVMREVSTGITKFFVWLLEKQPILGGALFNFIQPPLVITGMHHLFLGVNIAMQGELGYTYLWPISEMVTTAQGAACIAMYFVLKKKDKLRGVAISSTVSAYTGITEPAIYGINLRFRYPFFAVMISSAVGGAFVASFGVRATLGLGGVLSILSVQPNYWLAYGIGWGLTFVLTIVLTLVFHKVFGKKRALAEAAKASVVSGETAKGKQESTKSVVVASDATTLDVQKETKMDGVETTVEMNNDAKEQAMREEPQAEIVEKGVLYSPLKGVLLPMQRSKDKTFAEGILGEGVLIVPSEGKAYAPCDATVVAVTPTKHGVGLCADNGAEILIHIGIDTVKLGGKYFEVKVAVGDKVKKGQLLVEFDLDKIVAEGFEIETPMVVSNKENFAGITASVPEGVVQVGDRLLVLQDKVQERAAVESEGVKPEVVSVMSEDEKEENGCEEGVSETVLVMDEGSGAEKGESEMATVMEADEAADASLAPKEMGTTTEPKPKKTTVPKASGAKSSGVKKTVANKATGAGAKATSTKTASGAKTAGTKTASTKQATSKKTNTTKK
ncbi:MAG: glucose PTS transporter subunit IIA [Firmicutes bacterium]|nr:glucose PTS transporter subunit IIA [Bacillota bacterium]